MEGGGSNDPPWVNPGLFECDAAWGEGGGGGELPAAYNSKKKTSFLI